MPMKNMLIMTVLAGALVAPTAAFSATVTNRDGSAHTLVVSEGGSQVEVSIGAGETIEICPQGCFVTMPNGDREVLTGPETLEIEGGRGKIL
jgi:hypothetical protein